MDNEQTLEEMAEKMAIDEGYPQSDKEHFETTYWTQHNIYAKGFIAGAKAMQGNSSVGWNDLYLGNGHKDAQGQFVQSGNVVNQIGISKTLLQIFNQIEIWYGDIQKRETGEELLKRLQNTIPQPPTQTEVNQ